MFLFELALSSRGLLQVLKAYIVNWEQWWNYFANELVARHDQLWMAIGLKLQGHFLPMKHMFPSSYNLAIISEYALNFKERNVKIKDSISIEYILYNILQENFECYKI